MYIDRPLMFHFVGSAWRRCATDGGFVASVIVSVRSCCAPMQFLPCVVLIPVFGCLSLACITSKFMRFGFKLRGHLHRGGGGRSWM